MNIKKIEVQKYTIVNKRQKVVEKSKTPISLPPLTPSPEKKKKKIYHDSRFALDFKPQFDLELNHILD